MSEMIVMSKKELDRVPILQRLKEGRINSATAAKQMDVCVRQVIRLKQRFEQAGPTGLSHKSRGRPGHHRLPERKVAKAKTLLAEKYADFKPTLAMEKLEANHKVKISKETVRQIMIAAGLWIPKAERLHAHYRAWRERKDHYGEMQQYDGSHHDWFEGRLPVCTLLLAIDDAEGKITHARFAGDEGVTNTFLFWNEYLRRNGKPLSIYLDRYSTYKINLGENQNEPDEMTQFQRAMEVDLGVKILHARSPEAKGRVERVFQTLQDRLVKELRLAGIQSDEAANKFLTETFIPAFNQKFGVPAKQSGDVHRAITRAELGRLASIFSIQTVRKVQNDFTISFHGGWYQLAQRQPTLVLKKDMVIVEERLDGTIHMRKGKQYLAAIRLPARPKRIIAVPVTGLTPAKQCPWIPPVGHPWRSKMWSRPVEALAVKKLTVSTPR